MKRFSLKFLLMLVTIAALLVWSLDSGYRQVYRETLATHGEIVIYGKKNPASQQVLLKVQYTPNGTKKERLKSVPAMVLQDTVELPSFSSINDKATGLWSVFDEGDTYFVFLAYPAKKGKSKVPGEFWHPGVHIGWGRGFWAKEYKTLKGLYPTLPYKSLPSERAYLYD